MADMICDLRGPVFTTLVLFFVIALFKDEGSQFLGGYLLAFLVFTVTGIFSKPDK
jgi:hypothetical protein